MEKRKFGNIEVSAIGLGCMGFTHAYGESPSEDESIRLVHFAYENGLLNTLMIHFNKILFNLLFFI